MRPQGTLRMALMATLVAPGLLSAQRPATDTLVWPLAPDPPRIQYLGQVQSERDIGRSEGLFARLRRMVVGGSPRVVGLQRPHDVVVEEGRFYVSDGGTGRLLVFDPARGSARALGESGPGRLLKPMGLGGDGAGGIYVADPSADRVAQFDGAGEFVRAYGGEGVLHNPVDVAVNEAAGRLYVVDSYLHQVVIFDAESGAVIGRIGRDSGDLEAKAERLAGAWEGGVHGAPQRPTPEGGVADRPDEGAASVETPGHGAGWVREPRDLVENRGVGPGEFRYPAFVAVAPDGTVYVSDGMNFRVQAFDAEGRFLRVFGRLGDTPGSFARPKGLDVDSEGHVYVADGAFGNVQVFDAEGRLLIAFGETGSGEGQLWLPLGLAVDARDRIYVADRYNSRIQIFEYLPLRPNAPVATGEEKESR